MTLQTHGGTAAEEAILSPERKFIPRLRVDWNNDGGYSHALSNMSAYIKNVTTRRSLRGSAPEEILLIEGASAAELEVQLSGYYNFIPLFKIFSPYQPDSLFWGKDTVGVEVIYELGVETSLGTVWYPQFIGQVRETSPDRGTGYVGLTALDRVEKLRRPVQIPFWAMYDYQRIVQGRIEGQLVGSEWIIDHCLKAADISPTPFRPATREENGLADDDPTGPQLWVSGVGGWIPSIGWVNNYPEQEFPDTEGTGAQMYEQEGWPHPDVTDGVRPMNLAGVGAGTDETLVYSALNRQSMNKNGIQVAGFTLVARGTNGTYYQTAPDFKVMNIDLGDGCDLELWIGDTGKFWSVWKSQSPVQTVTSPKVTIPTTGDAHRLIVMWDAFYPSGARVWLQAGTNTSGASWTDTGSVLTNPFQGDNLKGFVWTYRKVPMQDIFWTSSNYGGTSVEFMLPWAGAEATYAASLDRGLNRLSFQPDVNGNDAWDVISQVVGAEFGAAFWDESGIFRFWNRETIQNKATDIVREVHLDHLTGLGITNTLDSVRNIWTLDADRKVAVFNTVIDAEGVDQFYTPAGSNRVFRLWYDNVANIDPGQVTRYTSGTWNEWVNFGYVVQWFTGAVWEERNDFVSGIDIRCYLNAFGEVVVDIFNGYGFPARLAISDTQPAFRVRGTYLQDEGSQALSVKDTDSIARFQGRNMLLNSEWHQEFTNHAGLLDTMLNRTSYPVPTTTQVSLAGDPRIQLADALRIVDPDGFGEQFDVQVYSIDRVYDIETGLTDTYSVELSRRPAGIWDDPIMGRWDTSTFIWG